MTLQLFAHPFSSYCQKVLTALYENATPFDLRLLQFDGSDPETLEEFSTLWPLRKMPLLLDHGQPVIEATVIIEHLQHRHPGPVRLIPDDPEAALEVRFMDRVFDNYLQTPQQAVVAEALRGEGPRDPYGVEQAKAQLERTYGWLETRLQGRTWAAGEAFTLADCSAGPALFYADWTHPIGEAYPTVKAYRARLNARPSFARCIDQARPYRPLFPLGAPDRD